MKQIKVYITPEQWAEKRLQFMLSTYVQEHGRKLESIDEDIRQCGFELIESETTSEQPQPSEPHTDKVEAVKYFLNQLPDGYRERALAQVNKSFIRSRPLSRSVNEAVHRFCDFYKTKEGYLFWFYVGQHYLNENLPPLPND